MCSAAQFLSQVAGKGPDVCPFAAGHADYSPWQSQSGVVSDVYSARSGLGGGGENNPSHSFGAAVRCKSPLGCLPTAHDPCGQGGSTVFIPSTQSAFRNARSRDEFNQLQFRYIDL